MDDSLKCKFCDQAATVHLTQIINNKIHKVDLCENCAQQKGVSDPEGYSLAEMLMQHSSDFEAEAGRLQCGTCGCTTGDFKRTGRMGCADCYIAFEPLLEPILEDMHAGLRHVGKVPIFAQSRQSFNARLHSLKASLTRAVEEEAYEKAAQYRDEIQALEESTEEPIANEASND
ncbi:MAG: excinuclease ABC subunit B [Verrucomicrobia bacterium]|nr:excinuclease ABC subunit B [Verrucomicrobiota bacterium]